MSEDEATSNGRGGNKKEVAAGNVAKKHKRPMKPPVRRKSSASKKKKTKSGDGSNAMTIFTGILAAVAIGALIVAIVPQRADVRLEGANMESLFVPNQKAKFILGFHNYGQVNARLFENCGRFVNIDNGQWPTDPDVQFIGMCSPDQEVIEGGKTEYMGARIAIGAVDRPLVMPNWLIENIRSGKRPAVYMGRLKYRDAYSWLLNPFDIFGQQTLYYCSEYIAEDSRWGQCHMPGYSN